MTFEALFGRPPALTARAPGRVNLIGEHTDYNDGLVLPAPIPQHTEVQIAPTSGTTVRAWSANVASATPATVVSYELGQERPRRDWLDYVQGVTDALRKDGHAIDAFDLRVSSEVPAGSGLSSSAALEIALLRALRTAFDLPLGDVDLARLGQRAENDLVGAPVGIMDQMAASVGQPGQALFLDTADLSFELVPLPASLDLIVIDSLVRHNHASSEYRTRRAECEQACAALGIRRLRDADPPTPALLDRLRTLPDPLGRRARHVVTENVRVRQMVEALRTDRLEECGRLLYEGHASMRDDYQITVPDIDALVDVAREQPDVLGARMTGGGFGGAIVALTRAGAGRRAAQAIVAAHRARSGRDAVVLVP
jgi:galactokinase